MASQGIRYPHEEIYPKNIKNLWDGHLPHSSYFFGPKIKNLRYDVNIFRTRTADREFIFLLKRMEEAGEIKTFFLEEPLVKRYISTRSFRGVSRLDQAFCEKIKKEKWERPHPWKNPVLIPRRNSLRNTKSKPWGHRNQMKRFNLGEKATQKFYVTEEMITKFAEISGDTNPIHLDKKYASTSRFKKRIAHGILIAGFVSAVLGTELPGPGAIYISQTLKFTAPVYIGDTITVEVIVSNWDEQSKRLNLLTLCKNENGKIVLQGEAKLLIGDE